MSALRKAEIGRHLHQLRAPQPFPLTGDGRHMAAIFNRQMERTVYDGDALAAAIADARYRDWQAERARNGARNEIMHGAGR